jgi:hypothetical protein
MFRMCFIRRAGGRTALELLLNPLTRQNGCSAAFLTRL